MFRVENETPAPCHDDCTIGERIDTISRLDIEKRLHAMAASYCLGWQLVPVEYLESVGMTHLLTRISEVIDSDSPDSSIISEFCSLRTLGGLRQVD